MNDMRELQRENESLAARLSHMEAENLVNQTKRNQRRSTCCKQSK